MKFTNNFQLLVMLAGSLILAACGGSSSGGGAAPAGGGGGLSNGTFTKTDILDGAPFGNAGVFTNINTFRHYQHLFRAQDIKASGFISSVRLRLYSTLANDVTCLNTTIKLGHTSETDLNADMTMNVEQDKGSMVSAVDLGAIVIPAGDADDYFDITFDTPLYYNGIDNLVLDIERSAACTGALALKVTPALVSFTNYAVAGNILTSNTADDTGNYRLDAQFVFVGGDNLVDSPTGNLGSNLIPLNTNATAFRKVQLLYPAADVNGNGPITGIGIPIGELTTAQTYTVNVKLGHTNQSALVSGAFEDSYSDTPVTVATNLEFTVPAGVPVDEVVWLPITDSFSYNGTDNLILEIETVDNSGASAATRWRNRDLTGTDRRLFGDLGSATGTADDNYYFAKFRFNGGTMDIITDEVNPTTHFFRSFSDPSIQTLYYASELGTSGLITKVACRMSSTVSFMTSFPNYLITIGHTDAIALSPTYANNYLDSTVVYNGTYMMPDTHIRGDWVEFPITPFAYNGTDNLVIRFESDAATDTSCYASDDNGTRYPNNTVENADRTSPTGTTSHSKVDMRFWISK